MTISRKHVLHKSILALVHLKGGAGKSVLTAILAAIASRERNWRTVVVDLDANAPITRLALGDIKGLPTVKDALDAVSRGEDLSYMLQYSEAVNAWLLPGSFQGLDKQEIQMIPRLLEAIQAAYYEGSYVDLLLVDPPGENTHINAAVLAVANHVAMPFSMTSTDLAVTGKTLAFIRSMQKRREGLPEFLGIIPNRIERRGTFEKVYFDVVLESGKLLPYIPDSKVIKGCFTRNKAGGKTPIHYAPNAPATRRLIALFNALDTSDRDHAVYENDLREFLDLPVQLETITESESVVSAER